MRQSREEMGLLEYARAKVAMRCVYNMESTVRLDAVQSLGWYGETTEPDPLKVLIKGGRRGRKYCREMF